MQTEPYRVPLRRKDGSIAAHVLIDDADRELAELSWYLGSRGYAMRQYRYRDEENRRRMHAEMMHRRIMGLVHGDGLEVDHINHDKLDNRRANLRVVTRSENEQNKVRKPGMHGYRNVAWDARRGYYIARVKINGVQKVKVGFPDAQSAAIAADELRRKWHPCAF